MNLTVEVSTVPDSNIKQQTAKDAEFSMIGNSLEICAKPEPGEDGPWNFVSLDMSTDDMKALIDILEWQLYHTEEMDEKPIDQ